MNFIQTLFLFTLAITSASETDHGLVKASEPSPKSEEISISSLLVDFPTERLATADGIDYLACHGSVQIFSGLGSASLVQLLASIGFLVLSILAEDCRGPSCVRIPATVSSMIGVSMISGCFFLISILRAFFATFQSVLGNSGAFIGTIASGVAVFIVPLYLVVQNAVASDPNHWAVRPSVVGAIHLLASLFGPFSAVFFQHLNYSDVLANLKQSLFKLAGSSSRDENEFDDPEGKAERVFVDDEMKNYKEMKIYNEDLLMLANELDERTDPRELQSFLHSPIMDKLATFQQARLIDTLFRRLSHCHRPIFQYAMQNFTWSQLEPFKTDIRALWQVISLRETWFLCIQLASANYLPMELALVLLQTYLGLLKPVKIEQIAE